jgi:sulfate adenylyltransferase
MTQLIEPYCGALVDLQVDADARQETAARCARRPSVRISERAACDLELLATGGFSPLSGFMGKADFESVVGSMRLADGQLFPIPVTLPVDHFEGLALDAEITLRDARNDLLAVMTVEEIYEWSTPALAANVLGTEDIGHPLVSELQQWGRFNLAGRLQVVSLPNHADFRALRLTPHETRNGLVKLGRPNVVAFQTRNPLHRVHEEMMRSATQMLDGALLLHPAVGLTKPGDVDHFTRVRTYKLVAENYYDRDRVVLALLPLAMRMAGPREAVWHAIIRRNYGASHFIVGRDHASPGLDSNGVPFYAPEAAQKLALEHAEEIGVGIVPFGEMVFLPDENRFIDSAEADGRKTFALSGTEIREKYLRRATPLPAWFTRPEVSQILLESYPPPHKQGVCLWFTGLSGAGKSVTAEAVTALLAEHGRGVTLLDGDIVRTHLSKGLGFSREDRDANILRIGFVAAEIVRHGGVAICAAVSPYGATRGQVRKMMPAGAFVEIFVDTPLEVCESRDTKGMYARARRGEIEGFTGIDDPYEAPSNPEITIDTVTGSVEANAARIFKYLEDCGFIAGSGRSDD